MCWFHMLIYILMLATEIYSFNYGSSIAFYTRSIMTTSNNSVSNANDDGYETILRASITLKNGKKLYAWQKGLKAFPIRVKKK